MIIPTAKLIDKETEPLERIASKQKTSALSDSDKASLHLQHQEDEARVFTANNDIASQVSMFDPPDQKNNKQLKIRNAETTEPRVNRNVKTISTTPNSSHHKRLRPLNVQTITPVAPNPFVGPNGFVDLHTVLNARLDNISLTGSRSPGMKQRGGGTNFGQRSTSVGPASMTCSTAKDTTAVSQFEQRSQSVSRPQQVRPQFAYQQFQTRKQSTGLTSSLLSKIRKGVGLSPIVQQPRQQSRAMNQVLSPNKSPMINQRQTNTQERASDGQSSHNSEKQRLQVSQAEISRQARRQRIGSKIQFDYCPDEDSDNDIFTLQQNCPPGIKPPESKPNDPKQLHTWRQADRIVETYISKMENSNKKQLRNQRGPQRPVEKEPSRQTDKVLLDPLARQELQQRSATSNRSVPFHLANQSIQTNSELISMHDQQQERFQQRRTTTADFLSDRKRRGGPKFSLEFNRWIEKQRLEDPALVSDMQTILTPEKNRNSQQQGSVDLMSILVKRQSVFQKQSLKHPVIPGLNLNQATKKPQDAPIQIAMQFPSRQQHQSPAQTSRQYQARTPSLLIDDQGASQDAERPARKMITLKTKGQSQHNLEQDHSQTQRPEMKTVQSNEDNRIASHLSHQKQMNVKSNNLQFQPRQITVNLQQVDRDDSSFSKNNQSSNNTFSQASPRSAIQNSSDKTVNSSARTHRTADKLKLPVSDEEHKLNMKMYRQDSMLTHFRRIKVFNECKKELDEIKKKKHSDLLQGINSARKTLRIMLGIYWREFFKKRRRMHTGKTEAEDLKQSESEAKEAVLNRLFNMSNYVDKIEELINLNPITRTKLQEEAVDAINMPTKDSSDETTYSAIRLVILHKLKEATQEIAHLNEQKMAKLQLILDKYGSVEAYKEHIETKKREYENDRAAFLKKEQERKAQEEAAQKKENAKNSMENKLKVQRWLENYDKKVFEIVQDEIDILNELDKEEKLAGLCLIQDNAMDEHKNFLADRDDLNALIGTIQQEVKELKKTLKFQKTQKSGKLEITALKKNRSSKKDKKKSKQLTKEDKIILGTGSIETQTQLNLDVDNIEVPNMSICGSSEGDFDRDSDESLETSSQEDRRSRRSKQRQQSRANFVSQTMQQNPSSDISSDSGLPEEVELVKRRSVKTKNSLTMTNDSQGHQPSSQSNLTEKKRQNLKIKREKAYKRNKKHLRRQLSLDLTEIENRLFELEERYEEMGLDAILADYDPTKVIKNKSLQGDQFNAQSQLTSKLGDIFSGLKAGVKWDDEEKHHMEELDKEDRLRTLKSQKSGMMSKSTMMASRGAFIQTQTKPKAIEIFEQTCKNMKEKAPAIFKNVKNGVFEMKEVYLNGNQTYALQEAAKHFQNFADRVKLENNNLFDQDLSEIITSLTMVPALKQLSLIRNDFGDRTLKALQALLQKRFPNNLDELNIEGIRLKPQLTTNLMNTLNSSNLRKLQLIQINLNEESFNQFLEYVRKCQLEDLNLKDSRVTAAQFLLMLEVLCSNKKLRYLNLSYNNLVSQSATENYSSRFNFGNQLETIAEEGANPQKSPQQIQTARNNLTSQQAQVVDCISKFIRRNRNLIHLNLESTGLTYDMIKVLLVAVKNSRSLQALHLCGNPGVNEIQLIHDTVEMLNPINFSQWDDIAVAGMQTRNSKMKRSMHSSMTNRVISRASQRHIGGSTMSNLVGSERPGSRGGGGIMSPNSAASRDSNRFIINDSGLQSNEPTPKAKTTTKAGILKTPKAFGEAANDVNKMMLDTPLSNSDDEMDKMRKNQPSTLDILHKELGTKKYKSSLKSKLKPAQSSRLQVFQMERSGRKTVTFQQMKDSVQLLSHKKFILTRFVGHKLTMEHGHRWRLHLEQTKSSACWICEKWNYTLFFWTRQFGEKDQIKMSSDQLQDYEEKRRCLELFTPVELPQANPAAAKTNAYAKPGQRQQSSKALNVTQATRPDNDATQGIRRYEHKSPLFTGSFSRWEEPARMIRVKDFSHFIERRKVEYLNQLKQRGLIQKQPQKYQELSEKDKATYQLYKKDYIEKYEPEKWKEVMARSLKFRKPGLVNLFTLDTHIQPEVWVTAAFVQPGTHTYIVADYRGEKKQYHHQNVHECTVDPRQEEVVPYERVTKIKSGDVFNRWKTIFAGWPNENDVLFKQCIENDLKLWKVNRLINKDPEDYAETSQVLIKNAKLLVHLFMFLAAKSQFPAISCFDFGTFCQEAQIIDGKFILSTVDRQFIAATTKSQAAEPLIAQLKKVATKTEMIKIQPDNAMVRYQFLEILVRIAAEKYKGQTYTPWKGEPEQVTTFARATEILIQENIENRYSFDSCELIRFGRLWKNDVAGIFKANEALLQQLYTKMSKKKKYLSFEDTYKIVEKIEKPEQTQHAGLSLKDFTFIYGMSKLIIPDEVPKCSQYMRTKFLEMVELIGRLTIFKNWNTQMEDLPLHKQIQLCLDEIFEYHLGVYGFDLGVGEGSDVSSGESEDDY